MTSVSINPAMAGGGQVSASEQVSLTSTKVMTTLDTLFTAVSTVQILSLVSICVTTGTPAATTMQYQIIPTVGATTTISGTSASLASAVLGTTVVLNGTAVTTAPDILVAGPALGTTSARPIVFPAGTLGLVIGTGPTTGTWRHTLRYAPLTPGAYVIAA